MLFYMPSRWHQKCLSSCMYLFTIFSGLTEYLGTGLSLASPGEGGDRDTVVGVGVQTFDVQTLALGFRGF